MEKIDKKKYYLNIILTGKNLQIEKNQKKNLENQLNRKEIVKIEN